MSNGSPNSFIDTLYKNKLEQARKLLDVFDDSERQRRRERLAQIVRIPSSRIRSQPSKESEFGLPSSSQINRIDCGDYVREQIEIETRDGLRMPTYVLLPKTSTADNPVPAVLALHGHGYGSRELVGLTPEGQVEPEGTGIHKHFALSLVKRGLAVIVPELLGFGDRRLIEDSQLDKSPKDKGNSSCYKLSSYLIHLGETLAGVRTLETLIATDYALARPEIRSGSIGVMGLSGGAFVAYLAGALDERITAVVLSGYSNTYEDSYFFSRQHCLCDYIPGIVELGDMPDLIGLIAPRSLYLEVGRKDYLFPVEGAIKASEGLERYYEKLGAKERFVVDVFEGGHEISGIHSFDWLYKELTRNESPC
ncbi:dienelactone hydrolase family protein [Paenibacillus sinopodophylli]|uniref:dienelactone hydrolase family protein n=1 Tax=Paenibacillus sinopodophylli TaxID=1837342 RepID=UPI00110CF975|nr:alpha/beta hydrolase family protein [Paenibacillus sinopodophylli]